MQGEPEIGLVRTYMYKCMKTLPRHGVHGNQDIQVHTSEKNTPKNPNVKYLLHSVHFFEQPDVLNSEFFPSQQAEN